jgi:hypothetical protein
VATSTNFLSTSMTFCLVFCVGGASTIYDGARRAQKRDTLFLIGQHTVDWSSMYYCM